MPAHDDGDLEWEARLRFWRRKLGRIRLGVEPVEEQLARYRRVTLVLSAVVAGVALFILALFARAFRRPDVGLVVVLVLFSPVIALAWVDYGRLRSNALRFVREHEAHEKARSPDGA